MSLLFPYVGCGTILCSALFSSSCLVEEKYVFYLCFVVEEKDLAFFLVEEKGLLNKK